MEPVNKVCIVCPRGCMLKAEEIDGELVISNQSCPRGPVYLKQELVQPKRMLTTTIKVLGSKQKCLPVYASEYVDKEDVGDFIKYLKTLTVSAPIENNQIILDSINGKKVEIRASKQLK